MIKTRKADASMIHFLIGLILVLMAIFVFSRLIYSCMKGPDNSLKSFTELGEKLDAWNSDLQERDSHFLCLDNNELLLFFDNNTDNFVLFRRYDERFKYSDFDKSAYFLHHEKYSYDYFSSKADAYFVFNKPPACGNIACMVLCEDPINSRYERLEFSLDNKTRNLYDEKANIFFIRCGTKSSVKKLEKINKIYRKPYFLPPLYEVMTPEMKIKSGVAEAKTKVAVSFWQALVERGNWIRLEKAQKKFPTSKLEHMYDFALISGVLLQSSYFYVAYEQGTDESLLFSNAPLYLSERKDEEGTKLFQVFNRHYIYLVPYGNDLVICYEPPCLSSKDEIYIKWKSALDQCVDSSDCDVLNSKISTYFKNNKNEEVVFSRAYHELEIGLGEDSFVFEHHPDMMIVPSDNNPFRVNKVSLKHDYDAVNNIKIEANTKEYSLLKLSSQTKENKTELRFLVDEYEEQD